jgi:hypothetical protein
MTRYSHRAGLAVVAALLGFGGAALRAGVTGTEATIETEALGCGDVRMGQANLIADQPVSGDTFEVSATQDRIDIDYSPSREDFVTQPVHRAEESTAVALTSRVDVDSNFSPMFTVGGYRGYTDYRSVWLDEFYRQLFSGVPGYEPVSPHGLNALAGARWAYVPGAAFFQSTLILQDDTVSPGYEPQIGKPLLRGLEHLRTFAVRVSTENVLTPTLRSLVAVSVTGTTDRERRYTVQGSLNWAVGERLTLRTVVGEVSEGDEFHSVSGSADLERNWGERWFAGIAVRGYRDGGEVVDPLIPSSAATALRTVDVTASVRWQGERAAFRLEAGPYWTRYEPVGLASSQFASLYRGRDWRHVEGTTSWTF